MRSKFITKEMIKEASPCKKGYIELLEKYGNKFKVSLKQLLRDFPQHANWIEKHFSSIDYKGTFEVGQEVYFIALGNSDSIHFNKGKIAKIKHYKNWVEDGWSFDIDEYGWNNDIIRVSAMECETFATLRDLKLHLHRKVEELDEEDYHRRTNNAKG